LERDFSLTSGTFSAKKKKTEYRYVFPWFDDMIAFGAVRTRENNGFFSWQPVDKHIKK
jgi:hypothetical protein